MVCQNHQHSSFLQVIEDCLGYVIETRITGYTYYLTGEKRRITPRRD